jgi:hypothetical protein
MRTVALFAAQEAARGTPVKAASTQCGERRPRMFLLDASMTWCDGVRVLIDRRRRKAAANTPVYVHGADRVMARASVANPLGASLLGVSLLIAGLLAGCSTDGATTYIIDPGHYSAYHCDGLTKRLKDLQTRQQDLTNLMAKASEGGGGVLIGSMSYRADYENTVGEEKVLRRTAAEKKCDLPPPAVAGSPTPAAYAAPSAPPQPGYTGQVPPPAGTPIYQSDQTIR